MTPQHNGETIDGSGFTSGHGRASTVDQNEVDKFSAMAAEWWDPKGKFKPLHQINPVRLAYIRDHCVNQFELDGNSRTPFKGLKLADIGCGGGLSCEPMTRLGANVTGIDASEINIAIARQHAAEQGLDIDYRDTTAEEMAEKRNRFDIVLNLEVVEHVADVDLFLGASAKLLKPGGLLFMATLNRTLKAYALAIVGAERILRWLPRGTHQWEKFIKPGELAAMLEKTGLSVKDRAGIVYSPIGDQWRLSHDTDVNYMMVAHKPKRSG